MLLPYDDEGAGEARVVMVGASPCGRPARGLTKADILSRASVRAYGGLSSPAPLLKSYRFFENVFLSTRMKGGMLPPQFAYRSLDTRNICVLFVEELEASLQVELRKPGTVLTGVRCTLQ